MTELLTGHCIFFNRQQKWNYAPRTICACSAFVPDTCSAAVETAQHLVFDFRILDGYYLNLYSLYLTGDI